MKESKTKEESVDVKRQQHHPSNRMAAVLELRGDFLFVSSVQEVRVPQRTA